MTLEKLPVNVVPSTYIELRSVNSIRDFESQSASRNLRGTNAASCTLASPHSLGFLPHLPLGIVSSPSIGFWYFSARCCPVFLSSSFRSCHLTTDSLLSSFSPGAAMHLLPFFLVFPLALAVIARPSNVERSDVSSTGNFGSNGQDGESQDGGSNFADNGVSISVPGVTVENGVTISCE
ncbi:hypothetical protein PYCCODRAFT_1117129 [Trametes coccinea BRFM310]|uniref:Uncharacterized protein n=1 Tax=Trametes coccinea (strain BRFM310) TaxID=1353009 RepID=A0A1Y2ICJ2_TRAC3|nr:hypothetical protein PYCCODRAFT_1117129 [Trametes coccinea BRFM310]